MLNYRRPRGVELEYVTVATVGELRPGQRKLVDADGEPLAIFNIAGRYFAIADRCSHDEGPVGEGSLDGEAIVCPRHGARFSLETGKALTLPAVVDIPAYPVRVVGEEVQVGLPLLGAGPGRP
jgi:3-phenylpropionate/trans-cinnamate dioxygenase ferredoxin subunit